MSPIRSFEIIHHKKRYRILVQLLQRWTQKCQHSWFGSVNNLVRSNTIRKFMNEYCNRRLKIFEPNFFLHYESRPISRCCCFCCLLYSLQLLASSTLIYEARQQQYKRERAQKCILSKSQEARENPVQTQILVNEEQRPLEFLKLGGVVQQQLSTQKSFNFHMVVLVNFKKVATLA